MHYPIEVGVNATAIALPPAVGKEAAIVVALEVIAATQVDQPVGADADFNPVQSGPT